MKHFLSFCFLICLSCLPVCMQAQGIIDMKTKTAANAAERTQLLDIIRARVYEDYSQEMIFVVDHLKLSQGFAWFKGKAQRKDGKSIQVPPDVECCNVEALLKKSGGKWYLVEIGIFPTDLWWDQIWDRTGAPKYLFVEP